MKTLKVEEVYLEGYEKFGDVATRLPYFSEKIYDTAPSLGLLHRALSPFEAQYARQAV